MGRVCRTLPQVLQGRVGRTRLLRTSPFPAPLASSPVLCSLYFRSTPTCTQRFSFSSLQLSQTEFTPSLLLFNSLRSQIRTTQLLCKQSSPSPVTVARAWLTGLHPQQTTNYPCSYSSSAFAAQKCCISNPGWLKKCRALPSAGWYLGVFWFCVFVGFF